LDLLNLLTYKSAVSVFSQHRWSSLSTMLADADRFRVVPVSDCNVSWFAELHGQQTLLEANF